MQRVRPDVKHVKISDFPRTPWAVSFGLRPALMKTFNYCRQYPDKMESLRATLQFILQNIAKWDAAAKEVQFEGGSQKRPLQSATFNTAAVTTDRSGDLHDVVHPQMQYNDEIVQNHETPSHSNHIPRNGAFTVPSNELPTRPANLPANPLKQPTMPMQQQALLQASMPQVQEPTVDPQVGSAYVPDLAAVLANNAQR